VVHVPSVDQEDQRRIQREIDRLKKERTAHSNRIRSLLVLHGIKFRVSADFIQHLQRFGSGASRMRRVGIIALARKLLIAFWKYLQTGLVPEGARLMAIYEPSILTARDASGRWDFGGMA
jgi:hypothetical protein